MIDKKSAAFENSPGKSHHAYRKDLVNWAAVMKKVY